ncbi:putative receptor-like protein kinase At3g47110 [Hibiscus syriacus]|uniref:putative receptor-like protein kinase At3g47110 n=1 Tax=Hibiscus syriacus TaxID=106335 RepID=UPI001920A2E0|nr:putative receptor-like protein kinase At3g47110 [Hibiscus syriacus]
MELTRKHSEASISFLLVCFEAIIILSCFNLQGLNALGIATTTETPVVRGNDTDQQALLQFKAEITGDQLKVMKSWNSSIHFWSLSPYIGNLSFLRELNLVGNNFYNEIPSEIGRLKRLETLDLTNNSISGEIPFNLSACSKLTLVDMTGNQLTGEIHASLGLLSNLKILRFGNNSLRGNIPPSLGNLSSMEELDLTINGLTGIIPEALGRLTNLLIFTVASNEISGILLVSMFNLSSLRVFDIGANKIQVTLHSDLEITTPYMKIAENKIVGRIPDGIGNLINLDALDASINQLSGPIPFDNGRLQKLKIFYSHTNSLSGSIPHSIGNLTMLTKLALGFNNLKDNIPSSLGKCQMLLSLDLSNNNLGGPIPSEVLGLPSLTILLDLSSNHLTVELSVEVEKLRNLGQLCVSQNRLSGLLPNNLGSCVSLEKLFLDGNLFEGSIPSSLSSLRGLEALDTSDNNLSGEIPKFLVNLRALKYLNLSFNDFEGVLPSEGVFKNASTMFVEGNNKVCGGIPKLHLSRCDLKKSLDTSFKMKITIIIVILGVALVFACRLFLWLTKKEEKKPKTTSSENSLLQLSYQTILRATDGFNIHNLIGSGSFGSVYKGIIEESGATIAVKMLNLLNREASRSFLAECEALKNIRHRNLVKILIAVSGVDYKGNDFKALVFEFMENGSLEDWLHQSITMNEPGTMRNLNFFQRVNVAIDVAHALEYLHHHCETPIIHCDLKPSNILLDEEMVGHISDFGLAKILSAERLNHPTNHSSSRGLRGTFGYAPPEYGMGNELSTKGDVYSYGILLLEIFTGKRPTDEMFKEGLNLHNFRV